MPTLYGKKTASEELTGKIRDDYTSRERIIIGRKNFSSSDLGSNLLGNLANFPNNTACIYRASVTRQSVRKILVALLELDFHVGDRALTVIILMIQWCFCQLVLAKTHLNQHLQVISAEGRENVII